MSKSVVASVTVEISRVDDRFEYDIKSSRHPSIKPVELGIALHDAANEMICEALEIGKGVGHQSSEPPTAREEALAKATVIVDDMFAKAFGR